jgi:rsbT antagonist protein RsbS
VTAVPVVRFRDVVVAAMQEDIDDNGALALADRLAREVADAGARVVLVDVSAAQVVDSFISRVIVDIARVCRLLGAQVAVVGVRPAVAITLVELGLTLEGVRTALTIDDAMDALEEGAGGDGWRG